MAKQLTISIVNYNSKNSLKKCLSAIFEYTKGIDFDVIVVDNNSTDGSVTMVKNLFPQVKIIKNNENLGTSKAYNQVIRASNSPYVAVLNPNTFLTTNIFNKMVDFADNHQDAGIVGCRILNPDYTIQATNYNLPNIWTCIFHFIQIKLIIKSINVRKWIGKYFSKFLGKNISSYLSSYSDFDNFREVEIVSGCLFLMRRKALEEVGLFDESIFLYSEDMDLFRRMIYGGWKIYLLPDKGAIHYVHGTLERIFGKISIARYKGDFQYYKKYCKKITFNLLKITILIILIFRTIFSSFYNKNLAIKHLNLIKFLLNFR